jgi:hypothetical protein
LALGKHCNAVLPEVLEHDIFWLVWKRSSATSEICRPRSGAPTKWRSGTLQENQQIIIHVRDLPDTPSPMEPNGDGLPEWCNVYECLSDAEIADVEADILDRADLTRSDHSSSIGGRVS